MADICVRFLYRIVIDLGNGLPVRRHTISCIYVFIVNLTPQEPTLGELITESHLLKNHIFQFKLPISSDI